MKKIAILSVLALGSALVIACGGNKKTEAEEMPQQVVEVEEIKVQEVVVDPNKAAAEQKYIEGLRLFNAADYKGALKVWEEGEKLDPTNYDIKRGIDAAKSYLEQATAKYK
ncbi:hypothetical protein Emin_0632 [Elusimicrobium minutum Pei191]|uniref:Uncharacterized protein n=1 Tax=Elusimicrobium minutum (strain Pei191) TaxID=445932 RepID=B2KC60_ELUMP|nr:hypothetical protein [Elusimicrobium minutum]ACC98187.1 hypothetical protein Emin_0632 [Elusimicrobium minutum Pei191]